MTTRSGQCMCGSVKFTAETAERFNACYCKMCQRWSSGTFMGVHTQSFEVVEGQEHLTVFKSSPWAERAFCAKCGSNIYYHAPEHGAPSVALGSLDDTGGMNVAMQFFIDKKPDGFALANETKTMTEAQIMEKFGPV